MLTSKCNYSLSRGLYVLCASSLRCMGAHLVLHGVLRLISAYCFNHAMRVISPSQYGMFDYSSLSVHFLQRCRTKTSAGRPNTTFPGLRYAGIPHSSSYRSCLGN